jgi:hypothetical protein
MPQTAAKIGAKNPDSPEEVRKFDKGKVELVNVAGAAVGRAHSSLDCVKPLAQPDGCQAVHLGYQLSETMRRGWKMGQKLPPRLLMWFPPGHDAWVAGKEVVTFVDFQGMVSDAK